MLKEYSLLALQKAINCALTLDEDMPAKIKPLEGKVLEVVINPLNVCFFLNFHQGIGKGIWRILREMWLRIKLGLGCAEDGLSIGALCRP